MCPEGAGITGFTENREQICLRVQRLFLILVPGQVRSERRDDQKILFRPDQTVAQMISFIKQHASGKRKRTIHPAAVDRAAVALHIQPEKPFGQNAGTGLDLVGRGVTVRRNQVKALYLSLRKPERKNG